MNKQYLLLPFLLGLVGLMSACSTPRSMNSLAEKSAANASLFGSNLKKYAKARDTTAKRRVSHINGYHALADTLNVKGMLRREAMRLNGETNRLIRAVRVIKGTYDHTFEERVPIRIKFLRY